MAAPGQNYPMNPGQYPPQNYPPQQPGYYQAPPQQPGYYQGPPQQAPAGQYPGYPQAQPYPQPGYAVQGTQMTTTVIQQPVVTQQPVALQHVPVSMRCPHCGATIVTKLDHRVGQTTFAYCCMLSCFGCCWVPFCTECAKDVGHTCPNCQKELGVFKRKIVAESDGRGNKHNYDFHYGGPADDYVGPSDD